MRKQMMEDAAYEVATQVRAVEDSIEAALIEIAELKTKMVHARVATRAGFINTHEAFAQLAEVTGGLIAARGGIANCHAALAETKKTIPGLRETGFGDVGDCPPKASAADLRIVA